MKKEGTMVGLAHIGLFITDIERTKSFYTQILGFEVSHEAQLQSEEGVIKICFLSLGSLCVEAVQFPNPQKRGDGWFDHIAINVKNIEAVKKQLEEKGIAFEEENITHAPGVWENGSKWILFRGPDNEHLEINEVL